jgi:hypothetical protein
MKTKRTLLIAGAVSVIVLSAPWTSASDLRPVIVTDLAGTLRLEQPLPCNQRADVTTAVTGGRIELSPAQGIDVGDGNRKFNLAVLTLFFEPFTFTGSCLGFRDSHTVSEIGIRLAGAVSLVALALDGTFRIPKEQFLLYESIIDNRVAKSNYHHPSEDVTGAIDLERGTFELRIVAAMRVPFRAGCDARGENCAINEEHEGTQSLAVRGALVFSDADGDGVPDHGDNCPRIANISCTALGGKRFLVSAADGCEVPTLHLGDFSLRDGEVIQITETKQPGVRLVRTIGPDQIKSFQVGPGEGVIMAGAFSAACR